MENLLIDSLSLQETRLTQPAADPWESTRIIRWVRAAFFERFRDFGLSPL